MIKGAKKVLKKPKEAARAVDLNVSLKRIILLHLQLKEVDVVIELHSQEEDAETEFEQVYDNVEKHVTAVTKIIYRVLHVIKREE